MEQLEIKKWWLATSWKEMEELKTEQLKGYIPAGPHIPIGYYNPNCKHKRHSYDILTCEECIEYTKQKIVQDGKT